MKRIEKSPSRVADLLRGLIYPVVPILSVVSVWAYAYAMSLEAKLQSQMRSHDDDPTIAEVMPSGHFTVRRHDLPMESTPGFHVTSIDDQDWPGQR